MAVGGTAVTVGAGSVGSGKGVLVAGTAVDAAGGPVGAVWETAVACGTAVSVQPVKRRKREEIKRKAAVVFGSVMID